MENIYLKIPTIYDKDKWLDYYMETISDNPSAKPGGFSKNTNYEEWVMKINDAANGINLPEGWVPYSFYLLVNDEKIIGSISIRHDLDEMLRLYGGHIGYNIRPSERRKGYATKMLSLGLEKCKELGLKEVLITCKKDNIGSAKTIENNGGILEEEIYVKEEEAIFKKYWINVNENSVSNKVY